MLEKHIKQNGLRFRVQNQWVVMFGISCQILCLQRPRFSSSRKCMQYNQCLHYLQ